jgi:hypothetical protein
MSSHDDVHGGAVSRRIPKVDGLYAFPGLLADSFAGMSLFPRVRLANAAGPACGSRLIVTDDIIADIVQANLFNGGKRDQVMLFSRAPVRSCAIAGEEGCEVFSNCDVDDRHQENKEDPSSIPKYIQELLSHLSNILRPLIPKTMHDLLFSQPLARQIILNLYPPGTGITPHVDLPNRYADGILGVSLLGSCTMELESDVGEVERVYMPRGTVYALTGEARWDWSHGIQPSMEDVVWDDEKREGDYGVGEEEEEEWTGSSGSSQRVAGTGARPKARTIMRGTRLSVTFRWMKTGADLLI